MAPRDRPDAGYTRYAWYGGLLGGLLPILVVGFLYSALADRLAFAGWALAAAVFYTAALHQGLAAGWPAARLTGALALLLAVAAALFARLEALHHEVLDLGFRAVLTPIYTPAATAPRTAVLCAAALAGLGLAALAADRLGAARLGVGDDPSSPSTPRSTP